MSMTVRLLNPPRRRARKGRWIAAEFRAFDERCRRAWEALDRLWGYACHVEGMRAKDCKAMKALDQALHLALLYSHDLIDNHNGGRNAPWGLPDVRYPWSGRAVPERVPLDPLPRGMHRLSRDEWTALGRVAKGIRDDLMALTLSLNGIADARSVLRQLEAAERALDRLRCSLDSHCVRQHPDWDGFTDVFYGP